MFFSFTFLSLHKASERNADDVIRKTNKLSARRRIGLVHQSHDRQIPKSGKFPFYALHFRGMGERFGLESGDEIDIVW